VACVLTPLAVFETARHWLLFTGINDQWGAPNTDAYLMRGESLRAQASTGHSIPLGYVLSMGIGCWMYLKAYQDKKAATVFVFALLTLGVFVTYARGPWLAAAFVPIVFLALGSRNASSLAKGLLAFAAAAGLILMTPLGPSIIENLPFIGTANQGSVEYRQQLAETSWRLIKENPWFGNPFVLLQMEELRQGGIIDLVNAFANVALFYGLTGLALFVGAFAVGLVHAYRRLLVARRTDDEQAMTLGASLIACVLGTLLVMGTGGFSWWQWPLLGLVSAYAAMQSSSESVGFRHYARPVTWVNARARSNPARSV
jgi:O-antigen ligase